MKAIYESKNYTICTATVKEVAELDNLPTVQQVRGSVWPSEQAETFVKDVAAGKFFPAIVYTVDADGEKACVDGQQRSKALRDAYKLGKLTGEETVIVAISNNTIEDDFKRLNVGVPVAKVLVTTAEVGEAGDYILSVANHDYFTGVKFSGLQVQRCARADMAMSALAIVAGWDTPTSNTKDAAAWVKAHKADITAEAVEATNGYLTALADAVKPYTDYVGKFGKSSKATADARKLLSSLRRKNIFLTAIDAMQNGNEPADILAALTLTERLDAAAVPYEVTINGKTKKQVARWTVGGGSSGSNSDFVQRQVVLDAIIDTLTDADRKAALTASGKDSGKAKADAAAAVSELLG